MKRQQRGISLIERAVIEKEVRATFTSAQFHALAGDNSKEMVNKAGRIFFVVLGAAIADGLDADLPDIRILRGACNAMYDQAGETLIPQERRASIVSGLMACERLLRELDYDSVVKEAYKLHGLLKTSHVNWHHFQHLLSAVAA
ncbi:hypothetical protein LJR130_003813 [Variovorax sp. LjRoot130]|uniref:hypothetical protein n=1 Tax=unclassified Variovorax TaxID=663243 RepID=UPI003ECF5668